MICLRFYEKGWIQQTLLEHYEYTQKITADELKTLEKFLNQKYHNLMVVVGHRSGNTLGVTPSKATNTNSNESKFHNGEMQFL